MTLDAMTIVVYRTGITFVALYVWFTAKGMPAGEFRPYLPAMMLAGMLTTLHWATFFGSARVANVSISLAGLSTTAFWTSLFEPIFFKRKIRLFEVILGILVVFALYLIFSYEQASWLGLLISIFSAICVSLFTIINANLSKKLNPYLITLHEMRYAFLFALPINIFFAYQTGDWPIWKHWWPNTNDWLGLVFLSLVCTVYAYSASIEIMKRISAFAVNLTVNLEPVYGIILALLIFKEKEQMTLGFYAGALMILATVFSYPILNRKFGAVPQ